MQVIFLPSGSGPRRNYRCRMLLVCALVTGVLLGVGFGGVYVGYRFGQHPAGPEPVPRVVVERFAAVDAEQLMDLRAAVSEQREMLYESRQRLGDHFDSLGQRLGQIQAHVSRLNALGQRLTDMAGLDREEFSFDDLPAVGGPENAEPWQRIQEPEFTQTLETIDIALQEREGELQILEALLTDRELHQKQYPQGWPMAGGGWVSSRFGYRTDPFTGRKAFHEGVDIAARRGSEVRAMAAGVVTFAGRKPGYGLVIEVNHGNGYQTRYAHAQELIAKDGDRLEKGDPVALVGRTGRATGTHVHIEVLKNGKAVNPGGHLNASG